MLVLPLVKTRWGILQRDIFNMPTLEATYSKSKQNETNTHKTKIETVFIKTNTQKLTHKKTHSRLEAMTYILIWSNRKTKKT